MKQPELKASRFLLPRQFRPDYSRRGKEETTSRGEAARFAVRIQIGRRWPNDSVNKTEAS